MHTAFTLRVHSAKTTRETYLRYAKLLHTRTCPMHLLSLFEAVGQSVFLNLHLSSTPATQLSAPDVS